MAAKSKSKRKIFSEALEIKDVQERSSYLNEACGGDSNLRSRIDALLEAHESTGKFLEKPVLYDGTSLDEPSQGDGIGARIDRYLLVERIGAGGMAVVYHAQQEQPIKRNVALKIIKLGMDTEQVIARFEAERQALALMDHPSIAKIFDAGATESGRPYFVMELVQGISFTDYCEQHSLETEQRLELFVEVCRAVTHAHDRGIIHRDIKPSNVLIREQDGNPVPKVIDFGIAKATNLRLTERTLCTREAQIVGTPEYMSPEQAASGDSVIDEQTDVYSLGVLLYQVLTGCHPYQDTSLRDTSYAEMRRIIQETEPQRPSTRLKLQNHSRSGTSSKLASHSSLATELDWIVMKALEKEPERRYQTVAELCADIERYRNDEPTVAGPLNKMYRLQKFMRRHQPRVAAGLLAAAVLLMTATAATITLFSIRPTGTDEHAAGMVQRHVWDLHPDGDLTGTISMDGRFLSYVDWEAGNLALRDLTNKTSRLLTSNTNWDSLEGWNANSAISEDGQWIAYNWVLEEEVFCDLRVIGREGNDMRILYHDPKTYWIRVYAWSPDGKAVLA